MRIDRITCRDFRGVASVDIDLRATPRAVILGSNGVGKSTLCTDAPLFALFGRSIGPLVNMVRRGTDGCEASVVFDLRGTCYRVRRTYSLKSGSTLQLEQVDPETHAVTASVAEGGIRDVQAEIDTLLGFGVEALLCGPMMTQGDASRFTKATAAERLDYVAQILGAEHWREAYAEARAHRTACAGGLETLKERRATYAEHARKLTAFRDNVAAYELAGAGVEANEDPTELEAEQAAAASQLADLMRDLHQVRAWERERGTVRDELRDVERKRDRAADQLQFVRGQITDLSNAEPARALATISAEGHRIKAIVEADAEARRTQTALEQTLKVYADQTSALRLRPEACTMDRCGLITGALAAREKVTTAQAELNASPLLFTGAKIIELEAQRHALRAEYQRAQVAAKAEALLAELRAAEKLHAATVEEQAAGVQTLQARSDELSGQIAANDKPDALTEASQRRDIAQRSLTELERRNANRDRDRISYASDLRNAQGLLAGIEAHPVINPAEGIIAAKRALVIAEKAAEFVKVAPQIVVEARIGTIEAVANEILDDLFPGAKLRIEQTKHGVKTSRDELNVAVWQHGVEAPIETFSGGERFRLDLALRLGLSAAAGADVSTLVLDEGWGSQDESAVACLKSAVLSLAERFERIYIVTHRTEVADLFGKTLTVQTHDNITTISEG